MHNGTRDTVAFTGCSNALNPAKRNEIDQVIAIMERMGYQILISPYLFAVDSPYSGTGRERAQTLMGYFRDKHVKHIFDISGGDMANEVLPYLDFPDIAQSEATFWGYSDLTTIINAIYAKTGKTSVLYQIRNLAMFDRREEVHDFLNQKNRNLLNFSYEIVQGSTMQGQVTGGNMRCFLKLAGTPFWPDMRNKILLLESLGGTIPQMVTYLNQYKQMGVFDQIQGILLGTFTQMEKEQCNPGILELVRTYAGDDITIAVTPQIGHGKDAKAIKIGEEICL